MAHVLVCDDDEEFAAMVAMFLQSLGHTVKRCGHIIDVGTALLEKRPDLMVVDIEMPGGGAIAAVRLLKSLGAEDMPVIVCSGFPVDQQRPFFASLGRVKFFQKPLNLDDFAQAVSESLHPRR